MEPENTPAPLSPVQEQEPTISSSLSDKDHIIATIKRHPFGLVSMYLLAILGLGVAFGLMFWLVPTATEGDIQDKIMNYLMIFAVAASALVASFLMVATYVYRQNRWEITNDSVHQVSQRGLFNRQSSELSMANVEDVTVEKVGILASMFNFGTLRAETAGENSSFNFNYCPNPDKYARIILDARERYIEDEPLKAKRANEILNVPGGYKSN
jgi:uncharacterized membrane protein YdbT with pleckstrin-like domain